MPWFHAPWRAKPPTITSNPSLALQHHDHRIVYVQAPPGFADDGEHAIEARVSLGCEPPDLPGLLGAEIPGEDQIRFEPQRRALREPTTQSRERLADEEVREDGLGPSRAEASHDVPRVRGAAVVLICSTEIRRAALSLSPMKPRIAAAGCGRTVVGRRPRGARGPKAPFAERLTGCRSDAQTISRPG